ncbi:hypothetical protein PVAND_000934 [Polypedilum vanderplanki]|uniref:Uncharacterized protein n=1 Tax=Polypedilum vanderplanki TaxID=319348 RepID=A0A9J6BM13_POLVA|nr:hypothetical protein PVAND_000934 [Polypedilum vanderplanki]
MKKFSIFVINLFLISIFVKCQANINEKLTHECLKHYLKQRGENEEILDYVDSYFGSITDCESAVKSKLASIYANLRNRLQSDRVNRPFVECVLKDVEEDDDIGYEILVLKETAVEMISNWRFWKYFSKSSRLDELRDDAESIIKKTLLKCKGYRKFGDYFSLIQDLGALPNVTRSGEQEYCIRTVLKEKGCINSLYDFRDNPKNVRTSTLNCTIVYNEVVEDLYNSMYKSNEASNCILDIYKKENYADYVLTAELLSKISLSKSDKSKEKQNFINKMVDISYETKNC